MISRSRFIATIGMASFLALVAVVITSQHTLVTARGAAGNMSGPSQFYAQHNLLSDVPGLADRTDPNVANAWGLDAGDTSPWWIADNGTGKTTLYNVAIGNVVTTFTVPGAAGAQGNP